MNREIKFRAWHKFLKLWIASGSISLNGKYSEANSDEIVLMQYTGLKDKNGKEIYEGDILKRENDRYYYSVHYGTLAFGLSQHREDGIFASSWEYSHNENEKAEIVGNIYDNPNLIK